MATNHLKETVVALVRALEDSSELEGILHRVYSFYPLGHSSYQVNPGELTLSVLVGDSDAEDPFINDSSSTDILPTEITIAIDTIFSNDEEMWISDDKQTMLDYEYLVIRALQESAFWNTSGNNQGWGVSGIERNVPVIHDTERGAVAMPEIARVEVIITVDVYLDRTDGPAR